MQDASRAPAFTKSTDHPWVKFKFRDEPATGRARRHTFRAATTSAARGNACQPQTRWGRVPPTYCGASRGHCRQPQQPLRCLADRCRSRSGLAVPCCLLRATRRDDVTHGSGFGRTLARTLLTGNPPAGMTPRNCPAPSRATSARANSSSRPTDGHIDPLSIRTDVPNSQQTTSGHYILLYLR